MKVINDLVVVEVPKGAKQFEYFDKETSPPAIIVHLESDENGMPNAYLINSLQAENCDKKCGNGEEPNQDIDFRSPEIQQEIKVIQEEIKRVHENAKPESYAIPPQQKQDDGDLWDEAEESIESDFGIPIKNLTGMAVLFYLKQHYNLTKK